MNNTQQIFQKRTLYKLKMRYGVPVIIAIRGTPTISAINYTNEVYWTNILIKRGILLPEDWRRKFDYDLAYIAANNNVTYGGLYDKNIQTLLIDATDVPANFEVTLNDEIVAVRTLQRFTVKNFERYEYVYRLELAQLKNPPQIPHKIAASISDHIQLGDTANHE